MTALAWDEPGSRTFETGVDRGVLYMLDGEAVPWNGLLSVSEKPWVSEVTPVYFDGIKFSDATTLGNFTGTLKALTYPDQFLRCEGIQDSGNGLYVTTQVPERFHLSYRTKVGNDVDGIDLGYKIHVIYNLTAVAAQKMYETISDPNATEFEWELSAIPEEISGFRHSAHLIFDTREMGELLLEDLERTLYGDEGTDARLPPISTLVTFIGDWVIIRITDNLDGTWTAEGPDELITMLDATTFQIIQANAVYLDADTYTISDTTY